MEKRVEGVLVRIRAKLDSYDLSKKANHEDVNKSVGKMINSLDKLIYDSTYFGKNMPEIIELSELKKMLKEVDVVNHHLYIERVKHKIDRILLNKRARLRLSFGQ